MAELAVSRWRESPLFTRLAWGLGIAFVALHLLYIARSAHDQLLSNAEVFALGTIERAQTLAEVAEDDSALLQRLSTPEFAVSLSTERPQPVLPRWEHSDEVAAAVGALLEAQRSPLRIADLWFEPPQRDAGRRSLPRLVMVLPREGRWLTVRADLRLASWRGSPAGMLGTTLFALVIFAAVLWGTRRVTRFLPRFADAADRIGRGLASDPLALEGPREVRKAAAAFNLMRERVADHVAERSTMMAAFSHDLRTLATRLGLRVEALPAGEARDRAEADLVAMTRILDEALAFARDEASTEAFVPVDVRALLQTLLDDAVDEAAQAAPPRQLTAELLTSSASEVWVLQAQPVALQRALMNLIDNAVLYGGDVRVRLQSLAGVDGRAGLSISICDPGPGIPPTEHDRVRKAYVRLEQSRSRETGGTGLGLAIVSNVLRRHGGTLVFESGVGAFANGKHGFIARVWLPRSGPADRAPRS